MARESEALDQAGLRRTRERLRPGPVAMARGGRIRTPIARLVAALLAVQDREGRVR